MKSDQAGLLLFRLLLYLELNCCEQISQKKEHNQSPDTAKLNNVVALTVANRRKTDIKMAAAEENSLCSLFMLSYLREKATSITD